jgi:ribonuclease BN (tRNA processing enzyme)
MRPKSLILSHIETRYQSRTQVAKKANHFVRGKRPNFIRKAQLPRMAA